ncbi:MULTISPECIES: NAD(P)H-dependent flavin oxidoreductase [unclassified Brevundimonas]|jgi:nitronate monooxygenase|uniref:NAD(P)H-dependent flavin oxidoreductase n=1 Tax=unclassified Brevundimonas TaxID=2622653 RepID=UPI000C63C025|nr:MULTISPECIES: nitronate monooxygenase family protein [unclassified Brevundimonas]MAL88085.1 nitronate monooxygenase [Brevundimonas sp.]HAJ03483.1 nitronate monooxygenase [Brevundimonas sp.]HAV48922.1 nitronate monooxygenase [Brevundimonas sp.]|tara:strand:- start:15963 stop:16895 length:933 start_codon:yes stop_codon:yes gene_type:complete
MTIPASLQKGLKLPVIAAPMFLVSGPDLVVEACNAGVIGTFPSLNQRTTEGYREWLKDIKARLKPDAAAFGVNHIVHPTNPRLMADMMVSVEEQVPLIITSLGAVRDVVDAVHGYGGVVFHDIANVRHARKAAEAGVDGLILVANGAGGHAGVVNPFALIEEVRSFFDGTLILSGCLSTGRDIAATRMLGADFAYMGTRFISTTESMAQGAYKQMIVDAGASDITYTPAVSGIPANFLTPSLIENGIDPKSLPEHKLDMADEAKAWKTVWSAGQGSGGVHDVLPVAELVSRMQQEYRQASEQFASESNFG